MSETEDQHEAEGTQSGAESERELQDLVLHLNFVPTWARESADKNPYSGGEFAESRGDRRDRPPPRRDDKDRGPRRPKGPGRDRRDERGRKPASGPGPGAGPAPREAAPQPGRFAGERDTRRFEPRAPRLPVEISFIPERNRLGSVVRQLHHSQRAYPLMFVAGLFLSHAEHHMLKIEVHGGGGGREPLKLFQCARCQAVFLDRDALQSHALARHMDDVVEVQDIQVDPPAGNFVCVARCRLSGELLGPPNYHGYNERVQEMRRERFPHLTLDDYRHQIEQVHDPALIEKWKDSQKSQRVYKLKATPDAPPLKRAEAESLFFNQHFPQMVRTGQRFVAPATAMQRIEDPRLGLAVREAWAREHRFPLRLSLALRPAFRRMRLHLFKAGRESFVTAIHPKPLDAQHVIEDIRQIIKLLHENPGITRQQLLEKLQPGAAPESPEASKALNPLRWLIEKGHVIEFFNGTLSVPGGARSTQAGVAPAEPRPQDGPVAV
jgi:hypothetical protein